MVQGAYKASFSPEGSASNSSQVSEHDAMMQEYNDVLNEVSKFGDRNGRRPRLLVAKMGQVDDFFCENEFWNIFLLYLKFFVIILKIINQYCSNISWRVHDTGIHVVAIIIFLCFWRIIILIYSIEY